MIYLACPYWHPDPLVRERRVLHASQCAAWFTKRGLFVYSPITHGHGVAQFADEPRTDFWTNHGIHILESACDSIVTLCLPGVAESRGVGLELRAAAQRALPMHWVDENFSYIEVPNWWKESWHDG